MTETPDEPGAAPPPQETPETPRAMSMPRGPRPAWLKRGIRTIVAVVVVGVGFTLFNNWRDKADDLTVGACIVRDGENDIKEAPCTDAGALKVLEKLENTQLDTGCPDATEASYTQQRGSNQFVLCLGPAT